MIGIKEYDSIYSLGKQLINTTDYLNIGKYYHLLGYYHENVTFNLDSAYYYHNLSKNQFIKIADSSRTGKRLLRIAIIKRLRNDYFGAKETLTEAIRFIDTTQNKNYVASFYNELAVNNSELFNKQEAINYYKKAINTSNDKRDILTYKNNLAIEHEELGETKKAIALFQELLKDSIVQANKKTYAEILHNLTFSRWLNGEKELDSIFLKALEIKKKHFDKEDLIASFKDLGHYYLEINPRKAKKYLDSTIQLSKELKIPKAETDALKLLIKINPENITFKDRYIFLKDSLYKQELKAKTKFAYMKYNSEQANKAVIILEKEKSLQTIEVAKQQTQKTIYLASGIILIIVGGFIFYIIKQQHAKDKLQEVYTTETRISRRVHDELANDVYHVINKIQKIPTPYENDVLNKLESIYKRTRDISYENGAINLDNNYFYIELKEMIGAYQNEKTKISIIGLSKSLWDKVDDYKKIATTRVLQELLTNMTKHSKASQVVITFKKTDKNINILYVDNGIGIKKPVNFKNNGLQNVENRIKNINGSFKFDLNRKKGLGIIISFPS